MSSGAVDAEKEAVVAEKEAEIMLCANCGIAQVDDIKLEECAGCQSVSYCSDKCRENHREQHEEECKKRKAVLRDKELFEQPDGTNFGECPLCFLPMPLDARKYTFWSCCCKIVCNGCSYADAISNGGDRCPFCREPGVNGKKENVKRVMKRVKANDPAAITYIGAKCIGEGNYDKAVEYYTKAAALGDATAHHHLGSMYYYGQGVEKDLEKAVYHLELAAMGGDPKARFHLASYEAKNNGNIERAVKHFIIAAKLGDEESMQVLWKFYSCGTITKEDLEATLRTHKAAIDATKSAQRDAAETYYR